MSFYAFWPLSRIKKLKLGLFCTKLRTLQYLVHIIVFKWVQLKIIVICLKLHVKLRFYWFLSFYGTFAHKVAQTCFVLQETGLTILFGIYYYVKVVKIENRSHMQ